MFAVFCCHCSKRAQSEQLSVLCGVCSKFSQPGKPAPRLASSHAKYPDIYRRSKPAVAKLRREVAAFGVNGVMEYKADISEARLGSAARRGKNLEELKSYARYKIWTSKRLPCASGQIVRQICILSTGDLPRMAKTTSMFANKFYLHQDRVAIGCLEERLFNNTRDEFIGRKSFNTSFYLKKDFVLHQVPPN
ncbi:beta-1,3-galactosyl-O-glycosyl-glycoprotein beta-1,6-N-acetylglucosaminyltransferase [Elysia marginata]|uniref:Beta-1,3-galactosyl-O-glycosyl-glycoprotein beta-1,6-N-acetylglucosaminyltransferase n=1 Tax=Elysia marginata TaxID=1093978 RepID=A0AAV4I7Q0_9GAST|nr:beta-1,3-galactosyl-O-glycosyl-glycoprotein beta-1,6-N-acetylglucosaminyltransferase [Elysia marginata]